MRSGAASRTSRRARSRPGPDDREIEEGLEQLRSLLVGPEQERLAQVETREVVTADRVAGVLPEAVGRSTQARDEALALSLEPAVTTIVRTFARKEAELFGEILSPTIGTAVRKAVADAIAAMMQRFNEALERSLSVRSIRWRIEARRTGRPFAEVVLLHTLVFRVEQVFLIHPGTGLLLEHAMDPSVGAAEPDQVAAMLEAIDSFVREAFGDRSPETHLSQVQFGDRMVWVDRAPSLAVAAVVRGTAPRELGELLRETRERIYLTHLTELARFTTDVSTFVDARPELERCLRVERRAPPRRAVYWLLTAGLALLIALAVFFTSVIDHRRLVAAHARALDGQPGIAVTSVDWSDGQVRISGFRDPLAEPPAELLARSGLGPAELRFAPFLALDPQLVEERARRSLRPPAGVKLSVAEGSLRAEGTAPRVWIDQARLLGPTLAGVERYDESALRSQEAVAAFGAAVRALEELEVRFDTGSSSPSADTEVRRAAEQAGRVLDASREAGQSVCVVVRGHADPRGTAEANQALSEARALGVTWALRDRGLPADNLRPVGSGILSEGTPERARSVDFRVTAGPGCAAAP